MIRHPARYLLPALAAMSLLLAACNDDAPTGEQPDTTTLGGPGEETSHQHDWTLLSDTPAGALLPAGTYGLNAYGVSSKVAVVQAPEGFSRYGDWTFVTDAPFHAMGFMTVEKVYSDPCAPTLHAQIESLVNPGPTVQDLADALAAQKNVRTSQPVPARVDGYQGVHLDYGLSKSRDAGACPDGTVPVLTTQDGGEWVLDEPHERAAIWILDVDGERLVLSWVAVPGVTPPQTQQLTDMVTSTRFVDGR